MASSMAVEFQELEECLSNLQELQKSLDEEVKRKNGKMIVDDMRNKQNHEIIKIPKEIKAEIPIIEPKTKSQANKQVCTDLDQLLQMMRLSETNLDITDGDNESPKRNCPSKSHQSDVLQSNNTNNKSNSVSRLKNWKLEEHNQTLANRFKLDKRISYYSSMPKIVPTNDEDCFTIIYKSSSQTNLSQPNSDYKIPFTVYQPNRTMKTILIDEFTTAGDICQLLTARNYLMPSIKFSLVEKTSHLKIERIFEDDETPLLCLLSYPDGNDKSMIFFEDREDKYGLFTDPGKWLGSSFVDNNNDKDYIREIFDGAVPQLPRYKSHLFYRKIHRKTWRRSLCVLRNSGLYAFKKSKKTNSTDLELIVGLHPSLHLYTTIGGWSQYKTPTPYGFCIKTLGEQNPKYISFFCALSEASLRYWSSMFRIALKGKTLLVNYQNQLQFVSYTLNSFQEMNEIKLLPHLSKSLGCVTGRSDIHTDFSN